MEVTNTSGRSPAKNAASVPVAKVSKYSENKEFSPVVPSNFYGSSSGAKDKSPAGAESKSEPAHYGSKNTKFYISPKSTEERLPSYSDSVGATFSSINDKPIPEDYREPQAIPDETPDFDHGIAVTQEIVTTESANGGWEGTSVTEWVAPKASSWGETLDVNWAQGLDSEPRTVAPSQTWNDPSFMSIDIPPDLEDEDSSIRFWDKEYIEKHGPYTGGGQLPFLVRKHLHNEDHTLNRISISTELPDIQTPQISVESPGRASGSSPSKHETIFLSPAVLDEIRDSIPHPNALYCKRDHGWVIFYDGDLKSPLGSTVPTKTLDDKIAMSPLPNEIKRQGKNCASERNLLSEFNSHHYHRHVAAQYAYSFPMLT